MVEKILSNVQFWGWTVQTLIIIAGFCIIKFNDLKHLTANVKEISEDLKANIAKTEKLVTKVAVNEKAIATLEKSKGK